MLNAHEVFGDASRKAHLQPQRLSPAQVQELLEIAAQGIDLSDEDADDE